jgi:hypothetical protein
VTAVAETESEAELVEGIGKVVFESEGYDGAGDEDNC